MKNNRFSLPLLLICVSFLLNCSQILPGSDNAQTESEIAETVTVESTAIPAPTNTPTVTPSPTATPEPTLTPTPAPLTAREVFELISPSVAFVETDDGTGSGILTLGNYLITNAHVVYPHNEVRVVFPDGAEFTEAPVVGYDLITDLALIGPLDVDLPQFELSNGEDAQVASTVYLIGYPGEIESFPQPAFTSGLISRIREWSSVGISYYQTDSAVAGGQSGGIMANDDGEIIGITGLRVTEANYGLVAAANDLHPLVEGLLNGEDVDLLGDRAYPSEDGLREIITELDDYRNTEIYVINEPPDTEVSITLEGLADSEALIFSPFGSILDFSETENDFSDGLYSESSAGRTYTFDTFFPGFYVIELYSYSDSPIDQTITSNVDLFYLDDRDDKTLLNKGDQVRGSIDYYGDFDYYLVELKEREEVNIKVDSLLVDAYIAIESAKDFEDTGVFDDDSGGGLLALNSEVTFKAREGGGYYIVVSDRFDSGIGGYTISINSPLAGDPTPIAPQVRQSELETSVDIDLELDEQAADGESETSALLPLTYRHSTDFTFDYPTGWVIGSERSEHELATLCVDGLVTNCVFGPEGEAFLVTVDELAEFDKNGMTLEEYGDLVEEQVAAVYTVDDRKSLTASDGTPGIIISATFTDELLTIQRVFYVKDDIAYNLSYVLAESTDGLEQEVIDLIFDSISLPE